MIDTSASNLFVAELTTACIGLRLSSSLDCVKMINTLERRICGISYDALIKMGTWRGHHHVRVVQLDDFEAIFGMNFLCRARVAVISYLHSLHMYDKRSLGFICCLGDWHEIVVAKSATFLGQYLPRPFHMVFAKGRRLLLYLYLKQLFLSLLYLLLSSLLYDFYDLMPSELPHILPYLLTKRSIIVWVNS